MDYRKYGDSIIKRLLKIIKKVLSLREIAKRAI